MRQNREIERTQRRADKTSSIAQKIASLWNNLVARGSASARFYATPAVIRRGESAQICYDVVNAKSVSLDPPVAEVWPSHTRCFGVSPKRTTTYTLTVTDAKGKTATNKVQVQVR